MTRPAAVIFDLDGTLIDSESIALDVGARLLTGMGVADSRTILARLVGVDGSEGRRRLQALAGPGFDVEAFALSWEIEAETAFATGVPLMAGADTLLARLAAESLPRAVATNSRTAGALAKLGSAGLLHHFGADNVVGVDSVARAKPAPDLFLEAARRLDTEPARCLVFEDSAIGVSAALAAGMRVVQIPDMSHPAPGGSHLIAENLLDGARRAGLFG